MAKKTEKTKTVKKESKSDFALGLMVSDRVQLMDVRLINCKCEQKPEAIKGEKFYDITHSANVNVDKEKGYLLVFAQFHFKSGSNKQITEPMIIIEATFLLVYEIDDFEGLNKAAFEQFANLNGIYNAWPYWRELVQNTISRMELPPLTIPVFRITKTIKKKTASKKAKAKKVLKKTKVSKQT